MMKNLLKVKARRPSLMMKLLMRITNRRLMRVSLTKKVIRIQASLLCNPLKILRKKLKVLTTMKPDKNPNSQWNLRPNLYPLTDLNLLTLLKSTVMTKMFILRMIPRQVKPKRVVEPLFRKWVVNLALQEATVPELEYHPKLHL